MSEVDGDWGLVSVVRVGRVCVKCGDLSWVQRPSGKTSRDDGAGSLGDRVSFLVLGCMRGQGTGLIDGVGRLSRGQGSWRGCETDDLSVGEWDFSLERRAKESVDVLKAVNSKLRATVWLWRWR